MLFVFTALGCLLPMMHQSSMGTVVILLGYKLSPLWQSQLLTLYFLLTAFTMGYAVVVFESISCGGRFKRPMRVADHRPHLRHHGLWMLAVFMALRFVDLI